jgi:hypothetical protein
VAIKTWMIPVLAMTVMQGTASSAWALSDSNGKTYLQMSSAGVTTIDAPGATDTGATEINVVRGEHESELTAARLASIHGTPPSTALAVPNPPANAVNAAARKTFFRFNGLTHADQRLAGTGAYANSQFISSPPTRRCAWGMGLSWRRSTRRWQSTAPRQAHCSGGPRP